jgi:hypothetical protein
MHVKTKLKILKSYQPCLYEKGTSLECKYMLKSSDQPFELSRNGHAREHIKEWMESIQAFTFNVWTILPISLSRTHYLVQ